MSNKTHTYYPYKVARLIHYDYSSTKNWYIDFSAYDVTSGKLKRKRISQFNNIKSVEKRKLYCQKLINEINSQLIDGFHFDKNKLQEKKIIELQKSSNLFYTTEKAILKGFEILSNSLTKASYNTYNSVCNLFLNYLRDRDLVYEEINYLSNIHILEYIDELQNKQKLTGKTINKRISILKSICEVLKEREIIKENVFRKIKKQKEIITQQNKAYSKKQIRIIKKHLKDTDLLLWNFCQFIYYSFMRPNEIRQLTLKDIDLKNNVIYLSAEKSKTKRERYIYINKPFKKLLKNITADVNNKDHLIFTLNKKDGKQPLGKNTLGNRYRKELNFLGFEKEYTLYAWKHTGNVIGYKNGIDIYSLMKQNGHTSIDTTMRYLKSLGMLMDKELTTKFNSIKI